MVNVVFEVVVLDFLHFDRDLFAFDGNDILIKFAGGSNLPLFGLDGDGGSGSAFAVDDRRGETGLAETAGSVVAELAPRLGRDHIFCFAHGYPFVFTFILGIINVQDRKATKPIFRREYV